MKKHYLTFEKSLKDLDLDIENLISLDSESDKLNQLKIEREEKEKEIFSDLSAWQTVQLARHPNRPYTLDYIHGWCDDFVELHGDKAFADDHAVAVSYTHLRAHETVLDLVCRLLLEKKKQTTHHHILSTLFPQSLFRTLFYYSYSLTYTTYFLLLS